MPTIRSLKRQMAAIFAEHESLCLFFSGGSDSRLLLEVMLEIKPFFGILTFGDGWDREQSKQIDAVILEKNAKGIDFPQVFGYPALSHTLVGSNGDLGLVSQYAIDEGGNSTMLVRDLVDEGPCSFDIKLEPATQRPAPIEWSTYIHGSKRADRHWAFGEGPLVDEPERIVGTKTFLFPLLDWSHEQVRDVLKKEYGVDLSDQAELADIKCCSNCLKTTDRVFCPKAGHDIDGQGFDKEGNLQKVRDLLR